MTTTNSTGDTTARIAALPTAIFAIPMGMAGLGTSWIAASVVLGAPLAAAHIIMGAAALALIVSTAAYAAKAIASPQGIAADLAHATAPNYLPAWSMAVMLLAGWLSRDLLLAAEILWLTGALIHVALAVVIVRGWFSRNREIVSANPSLFIPIAGLLVGPPGGATFGYEILAWLLLAIGTVFWLVLFPIVVNRILFHDPLPREFLPTLFILIAPPALGFTALTVLEDGRLGPLAYAFLGTALFLFAVLATMARSFARVPFGLSWWAFTFPSAALATAAILFHSIVGTAWSGPLAALLLGVATIIIGWVAGRTIKAALKGTLLPRP